MKKSTRSLLGAGAVLLASALATMRRPPGLRVLSALGFLCSSRVAQHSDWARLGEPR
jgi:hypothetical protein